MYSSVLADFGYYIFMFKDQMMFNLGDIECIKVPKIMQLFVNKNVTFTRSLNDDVSNYFYDNYQS